MRYPGGVDVLAINRRRMVKALSRVCTEDGARPSRVDGVTLLRATKSCLPVPVLYEPCMVFVAQGRKRFHLPDHVLSYDARNYLVVTVPVPADCETEVDDTGPFLGVAVHISLDTLADLIFAGDTAVPALSPNRRAEERVRAPHLPPPVSEACVRLMDCLSSPSDARALGPQLVRGLHYRVLQDTAGDALRHLLIGSESRTQIHRILQRMHLDYSSPLDLTALAHEVGMSSSALHLHFRAVTATSPVQYLKTLRLHKARMLMVQTSLNAASAAERVGYSSPSQFSREFKRLFGAPPADEALRVRAAFGFTDQVSVAT